MEYILNRVSSGMKFQGVIRGKLLSWEDLSNVRWKKMERKKEESDELANKEAIMQSGSLYPKLTGIYKEAENARDIRAFI